jgi:hypothetical protein
MFGPVITHRRKIMKTYQSVLIGGLMALGLAACSSTGSNYHDSNSSGSAISGGMPNGSTVGGDTSSGRSSNSSTMSGTHTDGSDNGADNNAGAGASNNATNPGMPVAPSSATSTSGGANR